MAYTRMLRWYYRQERPLPPDLADVLRLVRAATDLQRQAVEQVLREFFVLQVDGWHQGRADEILAAYRAREPEREAKKANEATRLTRHRQERAALFQQLTAAGVHLPWNARIDDVRRAVAELPATQAATRAPAPSPSTAKPVTQSATATATPATATQYPVPSTQYPVPKVNTEDKTVVWGGAGGEQKPGAQPSAQAPKGSKRCPESWKPTPELMAWARAQRVDIDVEAELATMRDHQFAAARSDWDATFRNWIRRASPAGARAAPGAPRETALARERREQFEAMTGGLASAKAPAAPTRPAPRPPGPSESDDEYPHLPAPSRRLG